LSRERKNSDGNVKIIRGKNSNTKIKPRNHHLAQLSSSTRGLSYRALQHIALAFDLDNPNVIEDSKGGANLVQRERL
jgi:hypothetical protein